MCTIFYNSEYETVKRPVMFDIFNNRIKIITLSKIECNKTIGTQ